MKRLFSFYQRWCSPAFHFLSRSVGGMPHARCRFEPTCSVFAEEAIRVHGIRVGGIKAIFRLLKCHPFSGRGGFDPV